VRIPDDRTPNPVAKPSKRHRAPKVTRRAILAAPLPALGVTALALWATDPFAGTTPTVAETPAPATASLTRQDLSSQLTLNATLGYTGSYTISYQSSTGGGSNRARNSGPCPQPQSSRCR